MKLRHLFVDSRTPADILNDIRKRIPLRPQIIEDRKSLYIDSRLELGKDSLYFTFHRGKIFFPCPCSRDSISCGYFVLDTMVGCPFDCSYCYLQIYQNIRSISAYINLENKVASLARILKRRKKRIRVGTGEFCDSLTLEDFYPQVDIIYFYFKNLPQVIIELKTKSSNISNLLKLKPLRNFVVSWSLNPQNIVEREEKYTSGLRERISSARILVDKGWKVGFHFDPIVYYPGFEDDYLKVLRFIKKFPSHSVAWISLGTLRYPATLKKIIRERFPYTRILSYGEPLLTQEGKVRYFRKIRVEIYRFMSAHLRKTFKEVPIYLCMETPLVWKEVFGKIPEFHRYLFTNI